MFSKLTMSLAMAISLLFTNSAYAQQKTNANNKTPTTTAQSEKARQDELVAKKVLEEKELEEKRIAEEKAAIANATFVGYIKSHFTASYHGELILTRKDINSENPDDHDIQDAKIMHNPTLSYRPVPNLKLLVTSEFKYTDAEAKGSYINRHYRSLVLLTRENVLTEKDNGIKMDVGIGRRIFDRNHGAASSYGNSRINTSLSKKFGEKLSTSFFAQYLANDPVTAQIKDSTWKHSIELIPSFTFQITDKLSYFFNDDIVFNSPYTSNDHKNIDVSHEMNVGVLSYQFNDKNSSYFQFKYLHFAGNSFSQTPNNDDWFEYYIGHTYSVTPKFSLTGEIGSKIIGSKDGRDFFAKEAKYPELALYVDYSL